AVDQYGRLAAQVIGKHQARAYAADLDLRDPGTERLDCKNHSPAELVLVKGEVRGNVGARHVEEVELLERQRAHPPGFGRRFVAVASAHDPEPILPPRRAGG